MDRLKLSFPSKRSCVLRARCVAAALLLLFINANFAPAFNRAQIKSSGGGARLSASDAEFLEDLSSRSFQYFLEQTDPQTGLVLDRARTDGSVHDEDHRHTASIAATGFGLTALCVAAERNWMDRAAARGRVTTTLRFFAEKVPHVRGWFYHWMDWRTGERRWQSEVSSIDTALLLAGILTARSYFRDDREINHLATLIYNRVDFQWMLAGHGSTLSHGWKPETNFLKPRWDNYSEHMILYLLAVGSPTHSITTRSWLAWSRQRITYGGYTYITGGPLFIHQYAHAWVDFRDQRESWYPYTDYFANSVAATRAHKAFCLALAQEFPGYSENVWGITASDSPKGYVAWGGPPRDRAIDGTIVPAAAGGSLMFTPDITLPALRTMREQFGARVYGRYGFVDAFNPTTGWTGPDVIGISVGITLLSAENLRTGNVWRWFMRNHEIGRALQRVGLQRTNARRRTGSLQHSPRART